MLLAGYLGDPEAEPAVFQAAHLAYNLHNDALAILENRHFDVVKARARWAEFEASLKGRPGF
jgi:hypothetical protein